MAANAVTVTSTTSASVVVSSAAHSHPTKYYTKDEVIALIAAASAVPVVYSFTSGDTLTTSQLNAAVAMVAATPEVFVLPSMGDDQNGYYFDVIKGGAGTLTLNTADSDIIGASGLTSLLLEGTGFVHVRIQYLHSITAWIIHRYGGISGS